ncbi:hypothetical protein OG884_08335 [Streptosporangium sp. NBC_01755]|uniref:hypothetical protein n=1 Tax=unclassified Streptosporangium TaxID=2632669 RepID=UPI002DDB11DA|nr:MULTISPECIES: hypothetical protein [unclassified Streptosporangium]WSA26664.1 hypothetical protein OIE13_01825 [Streptosporangium sp. NBC_01810]WSD01912.1 hypothetical protein OG884_08335 [Streptosporangium sp. NBC_01755]
MTEPGEVLLRKALAGAVAGLDESRRLTLVEVAADGITTFDLRRDDLGRPRCRFDPVIPWTSLAGERGWDNPTQDPTEEAVIRAAGVHSHAALILVCSFPDSPLAGQALAWLHAARPEAMAFVQADVRVDALLREVLLNDPLDRPYELVVLERSVVTGGFELAAHRLFAIGARPGAVAEVTVRCEAGDERGTAFAVVAWGRRPLLLSLQSARLVPGRYDFLVELERPGRVRLLGLPGLAQDDRSWADLVAAVPRRVDTRTGSQHLICAVETSGAPGDIVKRLDRLRQMIATVSAGSSGHLQVSLVTYGAHSYDRRVPEGKVEVVDWLVSPGHALTSLTRLEERDPAPEGHPHGAQLEDMLAVVAGRIAAGEAERTVLLTVGDRSPHPARVNGRILPCPHRHDWRALLHRLEQYPGMAFGAICDRDVGKADPVWSRLGATALTWLDALDIREFGAELGLAAPPDQSIPFPLIEVP